MGQDREFTDEERTFLLETIYRFRTHWEQYEYACLEKDRDALIAEKEEDSTIFTEEFLQTEFEKESQLVMKTLYPKLFPEEGESVDASTVKDDVSKVPSSKKDKKASRDEHSKTPEDPEEEEKEMTVEEK